MRKPEHGMHEEAVTRVEQGEVGIAGHYADVKYAYTYGRGRQSLPDLLVVGEDISMMNQILRCGIQEQITEPGIYDFEPPEKVGDFRKVGEFHHGFIGRIKAQVSTHDLDLEYAEIVGTVGALELIRES